MGQTLDHKNIPEKCLNHLLTLTKSMPLHTAAPEADSF